LRHFLRQHKEQYSETFAKLRTVVPDQLKRFGNAVAGFVGMRKPETAQNNRDYIKHNIELLNSSGDTAAQLIPAYEKALTYSPSLAHVEIVRNESDAGGYAVVDFVAGNHKVYLPLAPESPQLVVEKYSKHPIALEVIAKVLKTDANSLLNDPKKLYTFVALHELGHAVQFGEYMDNPLDFEDARRKAYASLPVPNMGPVRLSEALSKPTSDARLWVEQNWDSLRLSHEISTTEELVALQGLSYRQMFHEGYADRFAALVMTSMEEPAKVAA
jgi:hypothetical protein